MVIAVAPFANVAYMKLEVEGGWTARILGVMASTRTDEVEARGGGSFDALVQLPEDGSGPGVLLLHEIFGVNSYVRSVAERLAGLGCVVLAPDLYWRIERNVALDQRTEEDVREGIGYTQRFDLEKGLEDCDSALEHLRVLPEVAGAVAVMGFCFGGTIAYHVAARSKPDAAVCYYGSGVPDALELANDITCPILFHFGGSDPYIARERVEAARRSLSHRPNVEFDIQENAGHAFDNHLAPMFHNPKAAAAAWDMSVAFLRRHLPL